MHYGATMIGMTSEKLWIPEGSGTTPYSAETQVIYGKIFLKNEGIFLAKGKLRKFTSWRAALKTLGTAPNRITLKCKMQTSIEPQGEIDR